MSKKLYIGNLPFSVTEEALKGLFSEIGNIESVNIITDKFTGRAKGFGFVEVSTGQDLGDVIRRFNGHNLNGRNISVDEARDNVSSDPSHTQKGCGLRLNERRGSVIRLY